MKLAITKYETNSMKTIIAVIKLNNTNKLLYISNITIDLEYIEHIQEAESEESNDAGNLDYDKFSLNVYDLRNEDNDEELKKQKNTVYKQNEGIRRKMASSDPKTRPVFLQNVMDEDRRSHKKIIEKSIN